MENNRKAIASVITYLAQLGVTGGVTGLCAVMMKMGYGKTKLGRAFAFTTSVCAGVCTAMGTEAILRSGAKRTVDALTDGIDALKNSIEFRKEDIQETQEDEA